MYRIGLQNGLVVSVESMHHLSDLTGIEGNFVDNAMITAERLPAHPRYDGENIIEVYDYLKTTVDKPQIIADGIDTATITATVDDPASAEIIELWLGETLIDIEPAANGQAQFQITMTEAGTLTLAVKSTTKYGQNNVTIEGV